MQMMQKLISMLLILTMVVSVIPARAFGSGSGGNVFDGMVLSGSDTRTIEIAGVEVFVAFSRTCDEFAVAEISIHNEALEGLHALHLLLYYCDNSLLPINACIEENSSELREFMAFSSTLEEVLFDGKISVFGLAAEEWGVHSSGRIISLKFQVLEDFDFESNPPVQIVLMDVLVKENWIRVTHSVRNEAFFGDDGGETDGERGGGGRVG